MALWRVPISGLLPYDLLQQPLSAGSMSQLLLSSAAQLLHVVLWRMWFVSESLRFLVRRRRREPDAGSRLLW